MLVAEVLFIYFYFRGEEMGYGVLCLVCYSEWVVEGIWRFLSYDCYYFVWFLMSFREYEIIVG